MNSEQFEKIIEDHEFEHLRLQINDSVVLETFHVDWDYFHEDNAFIYGENCTQSTAIFIDEIDTAHVEDLFLVLKIVR